MKIGINCFNISQGGTLTHLTNILNNSELNDIEIVIWSGTNALNEINEKKNIKKKEVNLLNKNLLIRIFWQFFFLPQEIKKEKIDVLFNPGGVYLGNFKNSVSMSQNLLLFENYELNRYKFKLRYFKFLILKYLQIYTFNKSKGLILLTEYTKKIILPFIKDKNKTLKIIPHGVIKNDIQKIKKIRNIQDCTVESPFTLIYVSTIDLYKHQWNVIDIVIELVNEGINLELILIGSYYLPAYKKMMSKIKLLDPYNKYIKYKGPLDFKDLKEYYLKSDLSIFASTCENMPNILLESMSYKIPILSSNKSPMLEILGDSGLVCDFENLKEAKNTMSKIIKSSKLRKKFSKNGSTLTSKYDWKNCSRDTFNFLESIYDQRD